MPRGVSVALRWRGVHGCNEFGKFEEVIKPRMLKLMSTILLSLAGCDRPVTLAEVEEIAEDSAPDSAALEGRTTDLEIEVKQLRSEQSKDITFLAEITRADANEVREVNAELERLSNSVKAFRAQVNYLRTLHGQPPMPEKK